MNGLAALYVFGRLDAVMYARYQCNTQRLYPSLPMRLIAGQVRARLVVTENVIRQLGHHSHRYGSINPKNSVLCIFASCLPALASSKRST
jgi:hypothetical protein